MSTTAKIIYILLAVFAVGLGIEGYFYYQSIRKPQSVFSPAPQNNQNTPKLIDITGQAIVGNLNLFDITKDQVAEWAKIQGSVEVPTYSGSIPTPPPQIQLNVLPKPNSIQVIAGYFKLISGSNIVLSQQGRNISLIPNLGARLWIKDKNKIQVVETFGSDFSSITWFAQFVKENDLVLSPNIQEVSGELKSSSIVIFR